jgi:hypothetical protein
MNRPELSAGNVVDHDVPMINELLMEWCRERKLDSDCSEARSTVRELHELFDIGVRDRETLSEAIASK